MLVKDIPNDFICIYKFIFPNKKVYIGQTKNLKRRMYEHNNLNKARAKVDKAIVEFGKIKEVEILEEFDTYNKEELNKREVYWISHYKSNNEKYGYNVTKGGSTLRGIDSPKAIATEEDILEIRKRRFNKERKKDVYKDYKNIGWYTFERIWEFSGYRGIGEEYYTPYDITPYCGESCSSSKLKEEDVKYIREQRDHGVPLLDLVNEYKQKGIGRTTIWNVYNNTTWKHLL